MRFFTDLLMKTISLACASFTVFMILFIILKIFIEALPSLSLDFLLTTEAQKEGFGGAIANAIVGTILLSTLSTIVAFPIALCTAIYLSEYSKENVFTKLIRFVIDVLSGTPSIVIGSLGLIVFVIYMKSYTGGFSLLSGIMAMVILIVPVMERYAEEAIKLVPKHLREAGYALGITKWQMIKGIVIPSALPGIISGALLSLARAAEESAVVVLTAGYSQFMPEFGIERREDLATGFGINPLHQRVGTLPIAVYHGYEFPQLVSRSEAFASAFVLIVFVMVINIIARLYVKRFK